MRHVIFIFAVLMCTLAAADDASLIGAWQLQAPQLWQQLELNRDGTYQRSIVTTVSRRTEIGRWRSDVSVLTLQPDHVITTQGARVPLPPRDRQIDVAGVDANSLTLYYDGDALETWQRLPRAAALPPASALATTAAKPLAPAKNSAAAKEAESVVTAGISSPEPLLRRTPRAITLPVPQVRLVDVHVDMPVPPDIRIAARTRAATLTTGYELSAMKAPVPPVMPRFSVAAAEIPPPPATAAVAARPAAADIYPEAQVVELITQIACEELRYPQRDPADSTLRYQRLAQALGFESRDPARLRRTLRYYQSNPEFLRLHQQTIAQNSMRCVKAPELVSTRQ